MKADQLQKPIAAQHSGGLPGGDIYHAPESDQYFAYYLSEQEQLLFLSKPYATEQHARRSLSAYEAGEFTAKARSDEQGHYLEYRRDSGGVAGISASFPTNAEAEAAQHPPALDKQPDEPDEPPKQQTAEPPRHRFRLELYPTGTEAPVRGRIEYALNQESMTFQGLDMPLVRAFIEKQLRSSQQKGRMPRIQQDGRLLLLRQGQPAQQTVFFASELEAVRFELPVEMLGEYEAIVYAKPFHSRHRILVGRKRGQGVPDSVDLFIESLESGLYRLEGSVHQLQDKEQGFALSSKPFHLYAEQEAATDEAMSPKRMSKESQAASRP